MAQVPQHQGEVTQQDGDVGVVGAVYMLADRQGAAQQRLSVTRPPQVAPNA